MRGGESLPPQVIDSPFPLGYNSAASGLTLRVVPLADVLLHEQVEFDRVDKLTARLETDRLLKNPPIVAPCDQRYILLDGATRVTALARLGCRDAVVQIVDYKTPGLVLETWNHLITGLSVSNFLQSLRQLAGLQLNVATIEQANESLALRESIGAVVLADGHALSLFGAESIVAQAQLLNQIVALYEGSGELHRVAHSKVNQLFAEHARFSALIVFPRYRPDEIQHLALNGCRLPTGITRHIIPGRAMRINLPLEFLQAAQTLAEKNQWLAEWLAEKTRERRVRYYPEPVFLFDE
jgi:hypothetical protein